MVETYSALLETKLAVVTSLVQITDSRWSLREAYNITRLTNLALLFIPMSLITSLLGMNDTICTRALILFFSIAVPVCGVIFLIAWFPEMKVSRLAKKVRELKRYFK
jgi:Mg2+ and Co2+ transporter CorA